MKKSGKVSRRRFLAASAAAIGPMILPSGVLAAPGRPGANDRIITGHIGVGGMGRHHLGRMRDHVACICEVDEHQAKKALESVKLDVPVYTDYRRVLERNDIDAVFIATPDHWHGVMMVHACEAGKDVYVEKPACKTIEEGQAMVRAANRYGRVVQVGSQGRSTPDAHAACTYLRNGMIGRVERVDCWHTENPVGGDPTKFGPAPSYLDWDKWLGPLRWRPYNPDYCHFNFRWMLDFGGGNIRDRGAHVFSVVSWFLDLDTRSPTRITATGDPPKTGIWDTPPTMEITYEYKDPDLTIVWGQPGNRGADATFGQTYYGTKGEMVFRGGDGGCGAEERVKQYEPPADGVRVFRSPGHHANFLECIKTREKTVMNIEAGRLIANMCILGNISYQLGRTLEWDAVAEQCVGDNEANRMLANPQRQPWRL